MYEGYSTEMILKLVLREIDAEAISNLGKGFSFDSSIVFDFKEDYRLDTHKGNPQWVLMSPSMESEYANVSDRLQKAIDQLPIGLSACQKQTIDDPRASRFFSQQYASRCVKLSVKIEADARYSDTRFRFFCTGNVVHDPYLDPSVKQKSELFYQRLKQHHSHVIQEIVDRAYNQYTELIDITVLRDQVQYSKSEVGEWSGAWIKFEEMSMAPLTETSQIYAIAWLLAEKHVQRSNNYKQYLRLESSPTMVKVSIIEDKPVLNSW